MQTEILDGLTLARPFWLLLLIPCLALSWLLYRRINHYSPWHSLLPAVMREALLQREPGKDHAGRFVLLASAWTLAIVALSGPVWEGESPVVRLNQSAVVVVLDLSHNMLANDLSPTRLERARLKIRDLLQIRSDSQIALVAYAGSAHRVTPLSSDQSTLINLLNGLSPDIMPVSGSNLGSALELAEQMVSPRHYADSVDNRECGRYSAQGLERSSQKAGPTTVDSGDRHRRRCTSGITRGWLHAR